ncbi:MAG TPA: hypothetical protein VF520_04985 [Thermoleophilaceae bacterium]
MIRKRLHAQDGIALVTAMIIIVLMMTLALATLRVVDEQTRQSGSERVRESSLNLAEGALNSQANFLIGHWPNVTTAAYAGCNTASPSTTCPDPQSLLNGLTAGDRNGATFATEVHDNGTGGYYDDTSTRALPSYDQNNDGMVWMRATATVKSQQRTVVALVKSFPGLSNTFPRYTITAGKVRTTNNGRKVIVDNGTGPGIAVRCNSGSAPGRGSSCLDWANDKGQVWPNSYKTNYPQLTAMSDTELNAMKLRAQSTTADGGVPAYYANCPQTLPSGPLVYIETGGCSYTSNTNFNSKTSPGILIIANGTFALSGTTNFYGIVYAANRTQSTAWNVVSLGGNAQIVGSVVVDYGGGVEAGSSKTNVVYDANAFNAIASSGTVGIVANSWRELVGG